MIAVGGNFYVTVLYRNVITDFRIFAQPLWCNKLLQISLVLRVTQQGYKGGRGPLGILKLSLPKWSY